MLKYDEKGLIPAIIQDASNNEILMFAFMNAESIRLTLEKGTSMPQLGHSFSVI